MNKTTIAFEQIPQLSKTDVAYATASPILRPFYKYEVDIKSFQQIIEDKSEQNINREALVAALKKQYQALDSNEIANDNIEKLLQSNTFTVTTAHQPSVLLGPFYYLHKIASTINLTKQLAAQYPDYQFVPMFVVGGEDHDFEEVNFINIFGKKLVWQNDEQGAVGMMSTATLRPLLDELHPILGESDNAKKIFSIIEKNYTQHDTYHTAAQGLLHDLFGQFGLVVLNTNDAALKKIFAPIMRKELIEQPSESIVTDTQQQLNALGFKAQAFPRAINLFYLTKNARERIVEENGFYKVLNTDISWSKAEVLALLDSHPEFFSPNVVLRPVYQEVILPNLAYVGGGGEIAYWLERKAQFERFGINFPMLIRRNSVVWIDETSQKKMEKLQLSTLDIFQDIDFLTKKFIQQNASAEINLSTEKEAINDVFERISALAQQIDTTLVGAIAAEGKKQLAAVEQLESRLLRAEKQKHEVALNQVKGLLQKFCPNGGLQERFDNFLPFYIKHGDQLFITLIENLNPLSQGFIVISE
jgi:bacillithiol synthase